MTMKRRSLQILLATITLGFHCQNSLARETAPANATNPSSSEPESVMPGTMLGCDDPRLRLAEMPDVTFEDWVQKYYKEPAKLEPDELDWGRKGMTLENQARRSHELDGSRGAWFLTPSADESKSSETKQNPRSGGSTKKAVVKNSSGDTGGVPEKLPGCSNWNSSWEGNESPKSYCAMCGGTYAKDSCSGKPVSFGENPKTYDFFWHPGTMDADKGFYLSFAPNSQNDKDACKLYVKCQAGGKALANLPAARACSVLKSHKLYLKIPMPKNYGKPEMIKASRDVNPST